MYEKIIILSDKLKSKIIKNYDIAKLTWFRTGGKADLFCIVDNESELEIILNNLENIPYQIIGAGSNLLTIFSNNYSIPFPVLAETKAASVVSIPNTSSI